MENKRTIKWPSFALLYQGSCLPNVNKWWVYANIPSFQGGEATTLKKKMCLNLKIHARCGTYPKSLFFQSKTFSISFDKSKRIGQRFSKPMGSLMREGAPGKAQESKNKHAHSICNAISEVLNWTQQLGARGPKAWLRDPAKETRVLVPKKETQIVNPLLITNQNLFECVIKQTSMQLELKALLLLCVFNYSYEISQEFTHIVDNISLLGMMTGNVLNQRGRFWSKAIIDIMVGAGRTHFS